jgi:hypothetical protein
MGPILEFLALPADLEAWLVLGYVGVILVGARVVEALARLHFARARRHAEQGFEYVADEDHYRCPGNERLSLHVLDEPRRLAVYRAPAASCNRCPLKGDCTPHDEGRHLYRSLAAWAETDLGRFHQRLSLLMFGVGSVLSVASLLHWWGQPGAGALLFALAASAASLARDVRGLRAGPPIDPEQST